MEAGRAMSASVRVLTGVSVVLIILLQASSAPVYGPETQLNPPVVTDYRTLPSYINVVNKIREESSPGAGKAISLFSNFTCSACTYAVKLVRDMFDLKMSYDAIAEALGELCTVSKFKDENVCKGAVQTFKVGVLWVC